MALTKVNSILVDGAINTDASGNVGIGTTNTSERLNLQNSAGRVSIFMASGPTNQGYISYFNATQQLSFGCGVPTGTGTNGGQQVNIDVNGNLLVGTTSSSGLTGSIGSPQGYGMNRNLTDQAGRRNWALVSESSAVGDCCLLSSTTNTASPNTVRLQVTSAGSCFNSTGTYGTLSDIKLKENIVDTTPKLEKLLQVRVVNYNRIGESNKELGVIAQELENIFPNMVEESTDLEDGQVTSTTTKAVKYSVFVPMLIKAIQEQQAIITDLKTRIETLEAK